MYLFECLSYFTSRPVSKLVECCEAYILTQRQEECYLVDK